MVVAGHPKSREGGAKGDNAFLRQIEKERPLSRKIKKEAVEAFQEGIDTAIDELSPTLEYEEVDSPKDILPLVRKRAKITKSAYLAYRRTYGYSLYVAKLHGHFTMHKVLAQPKWYK